MTGWIGRRWPLGGLAAAGLAGVVLQVAPAGPIKEPLIPAPLSTPRDDAAAAPVTPVLGIAPIVPPSLPPLPTESPLIPLPAPTPVKPAPAVPVIPPPALSSGPALPPILLPAPKPVEPIVPAKSPAFVAPELPFPIAVPVKPAPAPEPIPAPHVARPTPPPPPSVRVAPPAPPAKSAELPPPISPPQPDFRLRPAEPGHNVKSDGLAGPVSGALGVAPASRKPAAPAPGDDTVTLPTRQMVLSTALGLALTAAPTTPVRADDATNTAIAELKKTVGELKTQVDGLTRNQKDTDSLVFGTKDGSDGIARRLSVLEEKLTAVQVTLNKLEAKLVDPTRSTVGSSPLAAGSNPPIPQPMPSGPSATGATTPLASPLTGPKGVVRIVNEYPVEISLIVNTKSYRVAPSESRSIDVPAGSYTYELLQSGSQAQTSPIKDGETITLRVR
ncbi:MAG: hypothetical protein ACRC7O_18265 [Fimbriiglobus sp.]